VRVGRSSRMQTITELTARRRALHWDDAANGLVAAGLVARNGFVGLAVAGAGSASTPSPSPAFRPAFTNPLTGRRSTEPYDGSLCLFSAPTCRPLFSYCYSYRFHCPGFSGFRVLPTHAPFRPGPSHFRRMR